MRRRVIGYWEQDGTRHALFQGQEAPTGAVVHMGEAVPGPPPPTIDEVATKKVADALPGILYDIRDRPDFVGELQRRVKEVADTAR